MSDALYQLFQAAEGGLSALPDHAHLLYENGTLSASEMLAIEGLRASFFQDDEVVYQHILMASAKELDEAEEQLAATVFARRETAFALSQAFLDQIDPPATIKALLAEAIAETRQEAFVFPCFPAIDFPMALLSEGHREPPEHLMPLAVASLFYYTGIALYDDLLDQELPSFSLAPREGQVGLTAIALFAGLPAKVFQHDGAQPAEEMAYAKLSHIVQGIIYEQAIGQYLDLQVDLSHSELPQICEQVTTRKVGSTGALAAHLVSAQLALPDTVAQSLISFCTNLYISMQIASDIFDIWSKPVSPDLRNGTITLPIAYTFLALPEPERETFQQKLQAKCADVEHHKTLRQMMGKTNAFLYSLTKAETYRQKALMSLSQLEKQGLHNPYLTYFAKVTALCSA